MSNQLFLWSSVLVPWLTLPFMRRDDIKRYMPVALFGALITTIVVEVALALKWWIVRDAIFPFYHMLPFTYGGFLVGILWIFRLTYGNFLLYMVVNAIFEYILAFLITSMMTERGILEFVFISPLELLGINIVNAAILYGYQVWQEGIFAAEHRAHAATNLQPSAAKPLAQKKKPHKDKR